VRGGKTQDPNQAKLRKSRTNAGDFEIERTDCTIFRHAPVHALHSIDKWEVKRSGISLTSEIEGVKP
jgi:hypothetical protein